MLFTCGLLLCQVELRVCLALQSMQTCVQVTDPDLGVRMHAAFSQMHRLGFDKVCAACLDAIMHVNSSVDKDNSMTLARVPQSPEVTLTHLVASLSAVCEIHSSVAVSDDTCWH